VSVGMHVNTCVFLRLVFHNRRGNRENGAWVLSKKCWVIFSLPHTLSAQTMLSSNMSTISLMFRPINKHNN
jgi:hypothetical protein